MEKNESGSGGANTSYLEYRVKEIDSDPVTEIPEIYRKVGRGGCPETVGNTRW